MKIFCVSIELARKVSKLYDGFPSQNQGGDHAEPEWEPAMQSFILGDLKKETTKAFQVSVEKNFWTFPHEASIFWKGNQKRIAALITELRAKQEKTQASEKLQVWSVKYSDSQTQSKLHYS